MWLERYRYYGEIVKRSFGESAPFKWKLKSLFTGHSAARLSILPEPLLKSGKYVREARYKRKLAQRNRQLHHALFHKISQKLWLDRVMPEVAPPVCYYVAGSTIVPLKGEPLAACPQDFLELVMNHGSLFVKPGDQIGGAGAFLLEWREDTLFIDGRKSTSEELKHLSDGVRTGYVISEKIAQGDWSAQFFSETLNTIRITTGTSARGHKVCFIAATFKVGVSETVPTDNFKGGRGGWACGVDLETGELDRLVHYDDAIGARVEADEHPESGARVTGETIPDWPFVKETVSRLAGLLPHPGIVGWDIALTPNGPMVVELNTAPHIDIHQATTPIADTEEKRAYLREFGIPLD
ncbi:hypothetical protein K1W69_09855 [Hoeflea sp. WL0058]|uniref:Alpha-L-glutamate ligase-related protein ATP-grasp domain-containing protein n=1 Tax=Flavimaribacter sediminis TaxID=2865987 RepID=A0AAE3D115_9HYPH|nr:sugar-transfer associated ATP-grasp domain-containing protein [Flavimaribacter sediminis]MBW8637492.1 hypothetical protein [Flavimaribacter sediminis]